MLPVLALRRSIKHIFEIFEDDIFLYTYQLEKEYLITLRNAVNIGK